MYIYIYIYIYAFCRNARGAVGAHLSYPCPGPVATSAPVRGVLAMYRIRTRHGRQQCGRGGLHAFSVLRATSSATVTRWQRARQIPRAATICSKAPIVVVEGFWLKMLCCCCRLRSIAPLVSLSLSLSLSLSPLASFFVSRSNRSCRNGSHHNNSSSSIRGSRPLPPPPPSMTLSLHSARRYVDIQRLAL